MFRETLDQHIEVMGSLEPLASQIETVGAQLAAAIGGGGKVLICGNGGSAADAQHFAAELVGRFETERQALPAIALTTDSSILTAVGNDYGFADVFARQVRALASAGDMLVGISTSGNSENVLRGVTAARQQGVGTIGLLGCDGGRLKVAVEQNIVIQCRRTARIQEAHILILHFWAGMIEDQVAGNH